MSRELTNEEVRNLIMLSLFDESEKYEITSDIAQEIYNRYKESTDWDHVFEPMPNEHKRNKMIELFKATDTAGE